MSTQLPLLKTQIKTWDWNGTFGGAALGDPNLNQMFSDAVNERYAAAGLGGGSSFGPISWENLQTAIWSLLKYYVKDFSTTEKKFYHINYIDQDNDKDISYSNPDYLQTWLDGWREIVPKGGLRRYYPLAIHSLTDKANGKSGRARFEYWDNVTPKDQAQYSGKFYEGGDGVWNLSDDQVSQPTTIKEIGRAQKGDYIGSWILEDARDMLNKLTKTYSTGKKWTIQDPTTTDYDGVISSFNFSYIPFEYWAGSSNELNIDSNKVDTVIENYSWTVVNPSPGYDGPSGGTGMTSYLLNPINYDIDWCISEATKQYSKQESFTNPPDSFSNIGFPYGGISAEFPDLGTGKGGIPDGWIQTIKQSSKIHFTEVGLSDKSKKISTYCLYSSGAGPSGKWVDLLRFSRFGQWYGFPDLDYRINNQGFYSDFGCELNTFNLDLSTYFKGEELLSDEIHSAKNPISAFPSVGGTIRLSAGIYDDEDGTSHIKYVPQATEFVNVEIKITLLTALTFFLTYGSGSIDVKYNEDGSVIYSEGSYDYGPYGRGDHHSGVQNDNGTFQIGSAWFGSFGWGYKGTMAISIIDWTTAFKYKG